MNQTDNSHPVDQLIELAIDQVIPLGMQLDVTYRCDLDCVHCYLRDRRRDELTLDEYHRLFEELARLGCLFVVFSGGDPFVRQDFLDILEAASPHHFSIRIITHAMAIDEAIASRLAQIGICRVYISVYHSDPVVHDTITRRPGSFERTIAGIDRLVRRSIPVTIKCPVFRLNTGAPAVMPPLAQSLGADLELSATIRGGNDESTDLLALNVDIETAAATACASLSACSPGRSIPQKNAEARRPGQAPDDPSGNSQVSGPLPTTLFPEAAQLLDGSARYPWGERLCLAAHTSAYVGPDGTVQPCLDYESPCGNVRQTPFERIWRESDLLGELRSLSRKNFESCLSCRDYGLCRLCPARAFRETGRPTEIALSNCREAAALRQALAKLAKTRVGKTKT